MDVNYPKKAVVTGAASGIGRALSLALAAEGWKVGIVDVDMEKAEETRAMVDAAGGEGLVFQANVRHLEEVQAAADHFFDRWGEVGLLVNNAGIGGGGYLEEIRMSDWEAVVETDYWGVVYGCYTFVPRMKKQGCGHVVNTSSIAGLMPIMGFAPYNTCKAAVISLSETLVVELAPFNIGVTVVCPPVVNTNIITNSLKLIDIEDTEDGKLVMEMIETAMRTTRLTIEEFARRVLRDVGKNRLYSLPKVSTRLIWLGIRMSPSLHYKTWAWLNRHDLAKRAMMAVVKLDLV